MKINVRYFYCDICGSDSF